MDGIPALDLWDLIIEVLHSSPNQINKSKDQESQGNLSRNTTLHMKNQNPTKHVNLDLNNVDHVSSYVRSSRFGAMLYVFEDNAALIKMIIKVRSPTMRHVSRTHRVALDWLFDMINLDPKIEIRYIDTKDQLADMLTKDNFTRDEWNNLLHLFNISHFSSLCCAQNFSLTSCRKTMAKRIQEQKEEDRIVAKSKPVAMNMTSTVSTNFSSVNHPIASKSPGILKASTGQPDARATRNSKPDAASSSQGRLKDAYLGGLMVETAEKPADSQKSKVSNHQNFLILNPGAVTRKEVTGEFVASRNSGNSESSEAGSTWRKSSRSYDKFMAEVQRMT